MKWVRGLLNAKLILEIEAPDLAFKRAFQWSVCVVCRGQMMKGHAVSTQGIRTLTQQYGVRERGEVGVAYQYMQYEITVLPSIFITAYNKNKVIFAMEIAQ